MKEKPSEVTRISRIKIKNYKGIEELEVKFPVPQLDIDPDITVIGSRNGMGKTSVLECCALALSALEVVQRDGNSQHVLNLDFLEERPYLEFSNLVVGGKAQFASIDVDLYISSKLFHLEIEISDTKIMIVNHSNGALNRFAAKLDKTLFEAICGMTTNPVINANCLFFHSDRKVKGGNLDLGLIKKSDVSEFKHIAIRSKMGALGLFESTSEEDSQNNIIKLDQLLKDYIGTTSAKLDYEDSGIDFRVKNKNGKGSYSFDGFSSGQKEIVSTLFLIWCSTKEQASVVIIDEPELHFNSEWHRRFVRSLVKIAPNNQYILATHSEDVMDSVDERNRILLVGTENAV